MSLIESIRDFSGNRKEFVDLLIKHEGEELSFCFDPKGFPYGFNVKPQFKENRFYWFQSLEVTDEALKSFQKTFKATHFFWKGHFKELFDSEVKPLEDLRMAYRMYSDEGDSGLDWSSIKEHEKDQFIEFLNSQQSREDALDLKF